MCSIHICWALMVLIWILFVAWRWSERELSGTVNWFPDPWPFIVFLCAIIATLVLYAVHLKVCV